MRSALVLPLMVVLLLSGCKHRNAGGGASPQPADGSSSRVGADKAAVARQQADLLNVQTTEMQTDVPAAVQRAIPPFKDALAQLTDDVLAGTPVSATDAQVQAALKAVMPVARDTDKGKPTPAPKPGQNEFDVPEKGDYGADVTPSVRRVQPGLLLVEESFSVMCGSDSMLLGYSNTGGHWKRVLRWQAKPYQQVSGAFGDMFQADLLPVQRNGHPVLLVVHGTPWCTSTESSFAMDTFQIDPGAYTDAPFWHAEHGYRRADEMFKLSLTRDGFQVRTSVDDPMGMEDGNVNRTGIIRYALVGNSMQRTLPIAMNSRESVAEWLDMPRDEARLFADAPPGSAAWKFWDTLSYSGKSLADTEKMPTPSYGDVRACSDPRQYQVEVKTEGHSADPKSTAPVASFYVQVVETGNGYRIRDVLPQANAACHGKVIALKQSGNPGDASGAQ